jgi:protein-S-isoprenylcysteine O-methyltransferase Ste14
MKMLMERIDAITMGKVGDAPLDPTYRRRLLLYEWAPLRAALGLISVMLGVVMVSLPALAKPRYEAFDRICCVASVVPFLGAVYFLVGGVFDYLELRRRLREP